MDQHNQPYYNPAGSEGSNDYNAGDAYYDQPNAYHQPPPPPAVQQGSELSAELQQKVHAWGQFAISLDARDKQLAGMASAAIFQAVYPTKPEDLPTSEASLKVIKGRFSEIEGMRKEATGKFAKITDALMVHEKAVAAEANKLTQAIIAVKKQHEDEQNKAKQKEIEFRRVREEAGNAVSVAHNYFTRTILDVIEGGYVYALTDGCIPPANIESFKEQIRQRARNTQFKPLRYEPKLLLHTMQEVSQVIDDAYANMWTAEQYMVYFEEQLKAKFLDYANAFNDKAAAIAASEKESQERLNQINDTLAQEQVANKLESMAIDTSTATPVVDTKELKKVFEVVAPETLEEAVIIMAAFVANKDKTAAKLKVNKWGSLTISQMANALGKVKSDDNAFQPDGLTFKVIDKL